MSGPMNGTVRGGTSPITISYRKVTKKPQVKRTRKFVGFKRVFANIALKAIELIEDIAYDEETEVLEAGEQQVVHWALEIDDPWGLNNESSVKCVRLPDKPAAGMSLEVVKIIDPDQPAQFHGTKPPGARAPRRPNHDAVREHMRRQLAEEEERQRQRPDELKQAMQAAGAFDPEIGPESLDEMFDTPGE